MYVRAGLLVEAQRRTTAVIYDCRARRGPDNSRSETEGREGTALEKEELRTRDACKHRGGEVPIVSVLVKYRQLTPPCRSLARRRAF